MAILPAILVIAYPAILVIAYDVTDKARAAGSIMGGVPDWQFSLCAPIFTNSL